MLFILSGEIKAIKKRYGIKARYYIPEEEAIKIADLKKRYREEW